MFTLCPLSLCGKSGFRPVLNKLLRFAGKRNRFLIETGHDPSGDAMPDVIFKRADYDRPALQDAVADIFQRLDPQRIGPGSRVLVKPNFLLAAPPEKAVLTHPEVLRAVVTHLLDMGARVRVSDSPPTGSFARLMKVGGFSRALDGLDVDCRPFRSTVAVDIGEPYGHIDIARAALEADAVVNLAKLKTHAQMLLTLGVKNLFGCILGLEKPQWHLRSGVDRDVFARLLVQIHYAVNPVLTIVDGILAMEGDGPGRSGTPRPLGRLVASIDAAAVDAAICHMLGVDPMDLPTCRAAARLGRMGDEPEISGDFKPVDGYRLPDQGAVLMGPPFLQGPVRRHVLQRPVVDPSACRTCGECWKICPAGAVARDGEQVCFDYDRCIRCYCCVEVCPHGALGTRTPPLGRVLRRWNLIK
jgi:uncharacterized protein (DUF362 family)/Pyruvate/2-oxoacid:ferredoxin oxidoreductase delta subunit